MSKYGTEAERKAWAAGFVEAEPECCTHGPGCPEVQAVFRAGQIEALRNVAIGLAFNVARMDEQGAHVLALSARLDRRVTIEALAKLGDAGAKRMVGDDA